MEWTRHQIIELAPNNLVSTKGKALSTDRSWESTGNNQSQIWGKCKSSGKRLYHVLIFFKERRFYCDCKSQQRPCRHTIGLLLYHLNKSEKPAENDIPPEWTVTLAKQTASSEVNEADINQRKAQQEKRLDQRIASMQSGADELERWLLDLIQQGLSVTANYDRDYWEKLAARMQDAKLGGIARRIRRFPQLQKEEDWHIRLLEEFAQLHLWIQGFRQINDLPVDLQEEVISLAGVSQKREELLKKEGLNDQWLVAGIMESEEDKLYLRKSYLIGSQTGRIALVMDYNYGKPSFEFNWPVGSTIEGTLVFYPGALNFRALVKRTKPSRQMLSIIDGYPDLEAFAEAYARAVAANPWLASFPAVLSAVKAVSHNQDLFIKDRTDKLLPLISGHTTGWSLLALSQDSSLTIFGLWNGKYFTPVSVLTKERVMLLQAVTIESLEDEMNKLQ